MSEVLSSIRSSSFQEIQVLIAGIRLNLYKMTGSSRHAAYGLASGFTSENRLMPEERRGAISR